MSHQRSANSFALINFGSYDTFSAAFEKVRNLDIKLPVTIVRRNLLFAHFGNGAPCTVSISEPVPHPFVDHSQLRHYGEKLDWKGA